MRTNIDINPIKPGDIKTKAELFQVIRKITAAGYFFEVRNYYEGNGRSAYMVRIVGHKSDI